MYVFAGRKWKIMNPMWRYNYGLFIQNVRNLICYFFVPILKNKSNVEWKSAFELRYAFDLEDRFCSLIVNTSF